MLRPCSSGTLCFSLFPPPRSSAGRVCAGTGGRGVGIRVTDLWLSDKKGIGRSASLIFSFYTWENQPDRHILGRRPMGISTVDRGELPKTAHPGHTHSSAGGESLMGVGGCKPDAEPTSIEPTPNASKLNTPPGK